MICWTREIADLELICSLLRAPISCKVRERELLLHKILGWIDWFLLSYTHQMEQVLNGCELPSCAWYQAFFWMYSNRYSWIISLFYFFSFYSYAFLHRPRLTLFPGIILIPCLWPLWSELVLSLALAIHCDILGKPTCRFFLVYIHWVVLFYLLFSPYTFHNGQAFWPINLSC